MRTYNGEIWTPADTPLEIEERDVLEEYSVR